MQITDDDLLADPLIFDDEIYRWNDALEEPSAEAKYSEHYSVLRHRIVTSPVVQKIYRLKYNINKPLEGLKSQNSENDGSILTAKLQKELRQRNLDSYEMDFDDFDLESEMLKYTSEQDHSKPIEIDLEETYEPELDEIFITVQQNSIKVNNQTIFEFPSTIRSTNVLKGSKLQDDLHDEDSLLVSLTSGYLLLIRFYHDEKVKPYVVQWWKLEKNSSGLPRLIDTGKDILVHGSGLGFALTAVQGVIRLFYCGQTLNGVLIDRFYNLTFDGTILHTCFLEPLKDAAIDGHAFLFSLVVTSHGRYLIRLFEWWIEESKVTEHTPMILANDFGVPVFVVPILDGVLLVMENRLVNVSLNQMLSADYSFYSKEFPGSFPISFHKPVSPIFAEKVGNEVLLATEGGVIQCVVLKDKEISISPVLKVAKLSQFILERNEEGYHLLYSCDLSSGGYLFFKTLNTALDVEKRDIFKDGEVLQKWNNWSPVLDVEVVDTKHKTQELWITHGKYLSRLKYGLSADKEINDSKLKKAYKVFHHIVNDDLYFIFSFIDKTLIFKYDQDELIAIADSGLDLVKRTVVLISFEGICFQITEDSIIIANFETEQLIRLDLEEDVILADCYSSYIAVVSDSVDVDSSTTLKVFEVDGAINEIESFVLPLQPNFVQFMSYDDKFFLLVGSSSSILVYLQGPDGFSKVNECELSISEPHDLVAMNNVVYLSSRYGEYVIYDLLSENSLTLQERVKIKLTDSPIDFFLTERFLLLISKNIWKLDLSSSIPMPIVFQELRNRTVFSAIALDDTALAVLRTDGFSIATVGTTQEPILKSIKIGQVSKKVKFISHLGVFAIITESSLLFTNKLNKLEERLYSKKKSSTIFEDEVPISLAEWILPTSEKSYRNLLVGCSSTCGGSLKILQPKFSPDSSNIIEVFELFNIKTAGAVLATEQLDGTTILYSSGKELYTSTYDVHDHKMLDPVCVYAAISIIMNIDVKGDEILISAKDFSVTRLKRGISAFHVVDDNAVVRKVTNSLFLDHNVTVTTDKLHCTISGVQDQHNKFKVYVPFVPKLKECQFLPTWYQDDTFLRFIAYGFGGDIQLYTLLDRARTLEYKEYYKPSRNGVPSSVTEKGFWEINEGPWRDNRDINMLEANELNNKHNVNIPDSLIQLLSAVSI